MGLYHDPRPTSRVFHTTFVGDTLTLLRQDPDFYERFHCHNHASTDRGPLGHIDDGGATTRKDFDVILERP